MSGNDLKRINRRVATLEQLERYAFSGAKAVMTVDQTLTTAAYTAVNWAAEEYDTDTYHDNSTNNDRLTVPEDGYYRIVSGVSFDSNSTGDRRARIRLNGATTLAQAREAAISGTGNKFCIVADVLLSEGDYVTIDVYQNSGGNLDMNRVNAYFPFFSIQKLGGS